MALLYFTNITTRPAMADAFTARLMISCPVRLQGSWSGQTLLHLALRALFAVAGG